MSDVSAPGVVVYRQDDGLWRWRWSSGGDSDVSLTSSHAADSREEALEQARSAYPDVEIEVQEPPDERRGKARASRVAQRFAVAVVLSYLMLRIARDRRERTAGGDSRIRF